MAVCLLGTPASEPCRSQASSSQEYDCVFPFKEPEAGCDREAAELNVSVSLMSQAVASCSHDGVSWEARWTCLAGMDMPALLLVGGHNSTQLAGAEGLGRLLQGCPSAPSGSTALVQSQTPSLNSSLTASAGCQVVSSADDSGHRLWNQTHSGPTPSPWLADLGQVSLPL